MGKLFVSLLLFFTSVMVITGTEDGSWLKTTDSDLDSLSLTQAASRAFFWISPYFNWKIFFVVLPFALMPVALVWLLLLYPPQKYYSNVPPPPQYVGYIKQNATYADSAFVDATAFSDNLF